MIVGTPYSPQKAFVTFAREFFESLARKDYAEALSALDTSESRWSKEVLAQRIASVLGGGVTIGSAANFTRSAEPQLSELEPGHFELSHRIPISSGWSEARANFRFVRKPGTEYFHVTLSGFTP
jgi:hypothetical protein